MRQFFANDQDHESAMTPQWVAGVDGCKAGWVAAFVGPNHVDIRVRVLPLFMEIFAAPEQPCLVAVDIPIGLPAHIGPQGRGPERAVRPLLGDGQSSVFAVPSRPGRFMRTTTAQPADWHWRRPTHPKKCPSSSS